MKDSVEVSWADLPGSSRLRKMKQKEAEQKIEDLLLRKRDPFGEMGFLDIETYYAKKVVWDHSLGQIDSVRFIKS